MSPVNRLKCFIYCFIAKLNNDNYEVVIDFYMCTVELRNATYKNWNKPESSLLRAHGGNIVKPKHNLD